MLRRHFSNATAGEVVVDVAVLFTDAGSGIDIVFGFARRVINDLRETRFDAAGDLLGFRFSRLNAFGFDRIDYRPELRFRSWIPRIENGLSSLRGWANSRQKRILYRESYAPPVSTLFIWTNGRAQTSKSCYSRCCIYIIYQPQSMG